MIYLQEETLVPIDHYDHKNKVKIIKQVTFLIIQM